MKRLLLVALLSLSVNMWADRGKNQQILQALCQKEYFLTDKEMGCTKCITTGTSEKITVEKIYEGAFAKKGAKSLLLDLTGPCFAHTPGAGAVALINEEKGRWKLAAIEPKRLALNCEKIVSPKLADALVCEPVFSSTGVSNIEETIIKVKGTELVFEKLISLIHDDDGACGELVHKTVRRSRILGDSNKDGEPDIHVGFDVMSGSRGFSERKTECEPAQNWKKQVYTLIWFRNGENFKLSPESESVLKEIKDFTN